MINLNELIDEWIKDSKKKETVVLKPNIPMQSPTNKNFLPPELSEIYSTFVSGANTIPNSYSITGSYSLTGSYVSGDYTPISPFARGIYHMDKIKSQETQTLKDNLDNLFNTLWDKEDEITELTKELNALKSESASSMNAWKHRYEITQESLTKAKSSYNFQSKNLADALKERDQLRKEKVDAEFLARKVVTLHEERTRLHEEYDKNLKEINRLNAELSIQKKADPSEIIQFKQQVTRLVEENAKLSCPGHYLPEVQRCGKCISCKLLDTTALLTQEKAISKALSNQVDRLLAEKNESSLTIDSMRSTINTLKEDVKNKDNQISHFRKIVTILRLGLKNIIHGGVFSRKSEAELALRRMEGYRAQNKLELIQLYSDETIKE